MTMHFTALTVPRPGLLLGVYTAAYAETGEGARRFHINCQNGYKYGDVQAKSSAVGPARYLGLTDPASPVAHSGSMGGWPPLRDDAAASN